MENLGFGRIQGKKKPKRALRRLSKAFDAGEVDSSSEDVGQWPVEREDIYDLSKNRVHEEKLAPGLAAEELPPGITEQDLRDAFAMFDFDGSGLCLIRYQP